MGDAVARLIVVRGPNPNQEYTLTQAQTTIGRSTTNDLVLPDPEVSRRHAQIVRETEGYSIEDWGSTNGTFVNGQRINTRTPLEDGDEIDLGESISMTFLHIVAAAPAPAETETTETAEAATIVDARDEWEWEIEQRQEASERRTVTPEGAPPPPVSASKPLDVWEAPAPEPEVETAPPPATSRPRRRLLSCVLIVLALVFLCAATLYFLDWYQQGRLLYCGPLRPFFETILGPFGFAPICP